MLDAHSYRVYAYPVCHGKTEVVEAIPRGNVACASSLVPGDTSPASYHPRGAVMPAISADTVALPRIPTVDPTAADRPVRSVTTAPSGFEGEGFPVRRAFAGVDLADLDPFVHMDQMGEVDYAPGEPKGTPWHPHRGFETVTYMIDGIFGHQDSNGGGGLDHRRRHPVDDRRRRDPAHRGAAGGAGDAAAGCSTASSSGSTCRPGCKMIPPRYQDIRGRAVALLSSPDGGALVRVIAGEVAGHDGPGVTHTPITLAHATLQPGRPAASCPGGPTSTRWCTCWPGRARSAPRRRPVRMGQLAVLRRGRRRHGRGRRQPRSAAAPSWRC